MFLQLMNGPELRNQDDDDLLILLLALSVARLERYSLRELSRQTDGHTRVREAWEHKVARYTDFEFVNYYHFTRIQIRDIVASLHLPEVRLLLI